MKHYILLIEMGYSRIVKDQLDYQTAYATAKRMSRNSTGFVYVREMETDRLKNVFYSGRELQV